MEKRPYYKLKGFFAENNIRNKDVADFLEISESTLSSKLNRNRQDFTTEQIRKLCTHYKLDANIFFLN